MADELTNRPHEGAPQRSLVDKVEELGAAVAAGLLTAERAVQLLLEYSDGGLTRVGTESLLAQSQTARATYADLRMDAEMRLAALRSRRQR